eukprot:TRINITY_DN8859_c0_g1_i5.p1 TRINITY_DN8859_c0_g1~~TRINITY_DN8859_c0_g1_i5.p1  ORF type:complete len:193 (+),score=28.94 TRINITY_DN8859_c0_g1_i5:62-640(+)
MKRARVLYQKHPAGDFVCHSTFVETCLKQAPPVPTLFQVAWIRCQGTQQLVSVFLMLITFELVASQDERVLFHRLDQHLDDLNYYSNGIITITWLLLAVFLVKTRDLPTHTSLTETVVYFTLIFLIEPVISQLTGSISSDTIYTTTLLLFALHLLVQPLSPSVTPDLAFVNQILGRGLAPRCAVSGPISPLA